VIPIHILSFVLKIMFDVIAIVRKEMVGPPEITVDLHLKPTAERFTSAAVA
jgi:hypothetical protein